MCKEQQSGNNLIMKPPKQKTVSWVWGVCTIQVELPSDWPLFNNVPDPCLPVMPHRGLPQ